MGLRALRALTGFTGPAFGTLRATGSTGPRALRAAYGTTGPTGPEGPYSNLNHDPCLLQLHCMEFVGNWSPGLMSCSWTCDCLIRNEMNGSAVRLQSLTPQIYTWWYFWKGGVVSDIFLERSHVHEKPSKNPWRKQLNSWITSGGGASIPQRVVVSFSC